MGPSFVHEDIRFSQYFSRLVRWVQNYVNSVASSILPSFSLVWRPGESNPTGNVFDTFESLYAAANAIQGYKVIYVDTSMGSANVPSGQWDFQGYCVWQGRSSVNPSQLTTVNFDDGSRISGVYRFIELFLVGNGSDITKSVVVASGYYYFVNCFLRNDGDAACPFFQAGPLHSSMIADLYNTTVQTGTNNAPFFACLFGSFTVKLIETSTLTDYAVRGGATGHPLGVSFQSPYSYISDIQGVNVVVTIQNGRFGVINVGSSFNPTVYRTYQVWTSSSSPEGNVVGSIGDLLVWTQGSTGNVLWVKETNDGGVNGWVNK